MHLDATQAAGANLKHQTNETSRRMDPHFVPHAVPWPVEWDSLGLYYVDRDSGLDFADVHFFSFVDIFSNKVRVAKNRALMKMLDCQGRLEKKTSKILHGLHRCVGGIWFWQLSGHVGQMIFQPYWVLATLPTIFRKYHTLRGETVGRNLIHTRVRTFSSWHIGFRTQEK